MFLTRVYLDKLCRDFQKDMGDVYRLHQRVMSAFDEKLPAEERVLFRVEEPKDSPPFMLVQAHTAPDWGKWSQDYILPTHLCPPTVLENPAIKEFEPTLREGPYVFRLRANPVADNSGKRRGLIREDKQREWLEHKGELHGFTPLRYYVYDEGFKRGYRGRRQMTFVSVVYEGVLRVDNLDMMREAVCNGVGRSRAFGFGLLSLRPMGGQL